MAPLRAGVQGGRGICMHMHTRVRMAPLRAGVQGGRGGRCGGHERGASVACQRARRIIARRDEFRSQRRRFPPLYVLRAPAQAEADDS